MLRPRTPDGVRDVTVFSGVAERGNQGGDPLELIALRAEIEDAEADDDVARSGLDAAAEIRMARHILERKAARDLHAELTQYVPELEPSAGHLASRSRSACGPRAGDCAS